jgi:ABC-type transporter MlaC component
MEYFNHTLENHYMQLLPRYTQEEVSVLIHDELKNEQETIEDVISIMEGEFMVVNFNYEFRQNASYLIEVNGTTGLIYRTKAKAI